MRKKKKKYIVLLTEQERPMLKELVYTGKAAAYRRTHAQVLLQANENTGATLKDSEIAERVGVSSSTVFRVRQRLFECGLMRR